MKIGIHQPQFLPWLPYFLKIEACDYFVFLDIVDYQKNGLQNRNQIKSINGKQWLTIPIKNKLGQKINGKDEGKERNMLKTGTRTERDKSYLLL